MNKSDRIKVLSTAKTIMKMYMDLKEHLKNDPFEMSARCQGYRDCLETMKLHDLISEYNLATGEILILVPQTKLVPWKTTNEALS